MTGNGFCWSNGPTARLMGMKSACHPRSPTCPRLAVAPMGGMLDGLQGVYGHGTRDDLPGPGSSATLIGVTDLLPTKPY